MARVSAFFIVLLFAASAAGQVVSRTWTGRADNDFSNPANWQPPGSIDNAVLTIPPIAFGVGDDPVVPIGLAEQPAALHVQGGNLTLGGSVTVTGDVTVDGGSLTNQGVSSPSLLVNGNLQIQNAGVVEGVQGQVQGNLTVIDNGRLAPFTPIGIEGDVREFVPGSAPGSIEGELFMVGSGVGVLLADGDLDLTVFKDPGGSVCIDSSRNANVEVAVHRGEFKTLNITANLIIQDLIVRSGGTARFDGPASTQRVGRVTNDGVVAGDATLEVDGDFNNRGTVQTPIVVVNDGPALLDSGGSTSRVTARGTAPLSVLQLQVNAEFNVRNNAQVTLDGAAGSSINTTDIEVEAGSTISSSQGQEIQADRMIAINGAVAAVVRSVQSSIGVIVNVNGTVDEVHIEGGGLHTTSVNGAGFVGLLEFHTEGDLSFEAGSDLRGQTLSLNGSAQTTIDGRITVEQFQVTGGTVHGQGSVQANTVRLEDADLTGSVPDLIGVQEFTTINSQFRPDAGQSLGFRPNASGGAVLNLDLASIADFADVQVEANATFSVNQAQDIRFDSLQLGAGTQVPNTSGIFEVETRLELGDGAVLNPPVILVPGTTSQELPGLFGPGSAADVTVDLGPGSNPFTLGDAFNASEFTLLDGDALMPEPARSDSASFGNATFMGGSMRLDENFDMDVGTASFNGAFVFSAPNFKVAGELNVPSAAQWLAQNDYTITFDNPGGITTANVNPAVILSCVEVAPGTQLFHDGDLNARNLKAGDQASLRSSNGGNTIIPAGGNSILEGPGAFGNLISGKSGSELLQVTGDPSADSFQHQGGTTSLRGGSIFNVVGDAFFSTGRLDFFGPGGKVIANAVRLNQTAVDRRAPDFDVLNSFIADVLFQASSGRITPIGQLVDIDIGLGVAHEIAVPTDSTLHCVRDVNLRHLKVEAGGTVEGDCNTPNCKTVRVSGSAEVAGDVHAVLELNNRDNTNNVQLEGSNGGSVHKLFVNRGNNRKSFEGILDANSIEFDSGTFVMANNSELHVRGSVDGSDALLLGDGMMMVGDLNLSDTDVDKFMTFRLAGNFQGDSDVVGGVFEFENTTDAPTSSIINAPGASLEILRVLGGASVVLAAPLETEDAQIESGASLDLAGHAFTMLDDLTIDGSLHGGLTTFPSSAFPDSVLSGTGLIERVLFDPQGPNRRLTLHDGVRIDQNLELRSGLLSVLSSAVPARIGGDLIVANAEVSGPAGSRLRILGELDWRGGTFESNGPDLELFSGASLGLGFDPTGAQVTTFVGTVPQLALHAGGSWNHLQVPSGTDLTLDSASAQELVVRGDALIEGTLRLARNARFEGAVDLLEAGLLDLPTTTLAPGGIGIPNVQLSGTLDFNGSFAGIAPLAIALNGGQQQAHFGSAFPGDVALSGSLKDLTGDILGHVHQPVPLRVGPSGLRVGSFTMLANLAGISQPLLDCLGRFHHQSGSSSVALRVRGNFRSEGGGHFDHLEFGAPGQPRPGVFEIDTLAGSAPLELAGDLSVHDRRRLSANLALEERAFQTATFRVSTDGSLDLAGHELRLRGIPTTVDGVFTIGAGGSLALGLQSAVRISAQGLVRLTGTPTLPALVRGDQARFDFTIEGAVEARHFRFDGPGSNPGLRLDRARFAAPPFDFRDGVFSDPSSQSALLQISATNPLLLHNLRFDNPLGTANAFNVRGFDPSSAPVALHNSSGDMPDAAHEIDPHDYLSFQNTRTELGAFAFLGGNEFVQIQWDTLAEDQVASFRVERSLSPTGPFQLIAELPAAGPSTYALSDGPMIPGTYHYRLIEVPIGASNQVLVASSATVFSIMPPAVLTVGPGGFFPDVASALAAAPLGQPITIRLLAGTYPAFTIDGTAHPRLLVFGEPGAMIDTASGPIVLTGGSAGQLVELRDLILGDGTNGGTALRIEDTAALVILDRLQLSGANGADAAVIASCSAVSMQHSDVSGLLRLKRASIAQIFGGAQSVIAIDDTSRAELVGTTAPTQPGPQSTVTSLGGSAPRLDVPSFSSPGNFLSLAIEGTPNTPYLVFLSGLPRFLSSPFVEARILIDPVAPFPLAFGTTNAAGFAAHQFPLLPAMTANAGLVAHFQAALQSPQSGQIRLTNLESSLLTQ